jgi:hypothetical protein
VRNIRAVLLAAGTHRPSTVDDLLHNNDVVLYDRRTDPEETVNLAGDPSHHALVTEYLHKLEALIDAEIGLDLDPLVTEKPVLLGAPRWRGDNT